MVGPIASLALIVSAGSAPTPDEKWVREAFSRMRAEGILSYRHGVVGTNAFIQTRTDLARDAVEASHKLKSVFAEVDAQIADENREIKDFSLKPNQTALDVHIFRQHLDDIADQVHWLKTLKDDLSSLRRMTKVFAPELAADGINPRDMARDIRRLQLRLWKQPTGGSRHTLRDECMVADR